MKRYPYDPSMECWWKTRFGPKITFVIWRHQKGQKDPKRVKKGLKWSKIMFFILFRHFLHEKVPLWPPYGMLMENPFWAKNHFWPMTSSKGPKSVKKGLKWSKIMFFIIFRHFLHEKVPLWPLYGILMENPFLVKNHFWPMTSPKGSKRPQNVCEKHRKVAGWGVVLAFLAK